jgi:Excalibur calcium-binding domain
VAGLVVLGVVVIAFGGGGSDHPGDGGAGNGGAGDGGDRGAAPSPRVERQKERHRRARERERARAQTGGGVCPPSQRVLEGVYDPQRLRVIDGCRAVRGRVARVLDEEDGDVHIDLALDRRYRRMLMPANYSERHGYLVVEFMPRDHGHLPRPSVGDRLALVGAYVDDKDHAWSELHPVWQLRVNGGPTHRSGPRGGGSPSSARSYNALSTCRTPSGGDCLPYGGSPLARSPGEGGDRDCRDFPNQRAAQRYYERKGGPASDPDRLDPDHDGVACESLPR